MILYTIFIVPDVLWDVSKKKKEPNVLLVIKTSKYKSNV